MKATMIANIFIKVVFTICVTFLSIRFNDASLLWWFILLPFIGYEYHQENKNNENGDKEKQLGGTE